jgi:hypothetical protein
MPTEVQNLLAAIDAGEVTPANAISRIEKAGGLAFIIASIYASTL